MNLKKQFTVVSILGLGISFPSYADVSPWLPTPESLTLTLSYVEQTADEFYFGREEMALPTDLDLSTTALNIVYGLTDSIALDATIGYAESDFSVVDNQLSGLTDSKLGFTWQLNNEFANDRLPSLALRLGIIIDGDYETGTINAIGDGGSGAELGFAVGKVINTYVALSADLGYRDRSEGVPEEVFYGASVYVTPIANLTTFVSYRVDDSLDGLQIGGPGFTPDRFPEVEEDKQYVQLGIQYNLTDSFGAGLSAAQVVDGRNTSTSDVYGINLSYRF